MRDMKKTGKKIGTLTIAAILGLSAVACGSGNGSDEMHHGQTETEISSDDAGHSVETESETGGDAETGSEAENSGNAQTNEIITPYDQLWTADDITFYVGETVKWYVELPEDTDLYDGMGGREDLGRVACEYSVKIPALGIGTDSYEYEDSQVNLSPGKTLVCEYTPVAAGNLVFTCWMGKDCHMNQIHVVEKD